MEEASLLNWLYGAAYNGLSQANTITAMFKPLVVCKSIDLPGRDPDATRAQVKEFWLSRRIEFTQDDEHVMIGQRGNMVANWTSFDQGQILASLTLLFDKPDSVAARMEVNTIGQCMTDWTKAYFFLEMRTFASMLSHNDSLKTEWQYFKKGRDRAAFLWSCSAMLLGNHMPGKDRAFFLSVDDLVHSNL
jgi:hypothetical protein